MYGARAGRLEQSVCCGNEHRKRERGMSDESVKCTRCGSTDVKGKRGIVNGSLIWGVSGWRYVCSKCGHKWLTTRRANDHKGQK